MPPVKFPLRRLFDRTEYPKPAAHADISFEPPVSSGDPLPKKSPDNPRAGFASAPLIDGILSFVMGDCISIGYQKGSTDALMVTWRAGDGTEVVTRMLPKEHRMEISDMAHVGQAFGVAGMMAAFAAGNRAFKEEWTTFLTESEEVNMHAVTVERVGCLSDIIYGVLAYGVPGRWPDAAEAHEWEVAEVKGVRKLALGEDDPENLRPKFARAAEFEAAMEVVEPVVVETTRYIGPELDIVRRMIERRVHVSLLGPAGVGKSICAIEALKLSGYSKPGVDFQLFSCHEEVRSSDLIGAWQPDGKGGYIWVDGPLTRSMRGNGGKGMPILVEELTRMPTKSQNVFISPLSDGYLVLNEKPDANGVGEVVVAGPDFVMLADMNVDPAVDDIDMLGQALSSRVRKVEFDYPTREMLVRIVRSETKCAPEVATAVAKMYDWARGKYLTHDVQVPISPRAARFWVEDYLDDFASNGGDHRAAAQHAAKVTWLRDVTGTDKALRDAALQEIEACFRPLDVRSGKGKQS